MACGCRKKRKNVTTAAPQPVVVKKAEKPKRA